MIRFLIDIYIFVLIVDSILSYFPDLRGHQYVQLLRKVAEASLRPVRKFLPPHWPVDVSPLIVILVLTAIKRLW